MYLGRSLEYEEFDVEEVDIVAVVGHAEKADRELRFELAMNRSAVGIKSAVGFD